MTETFFPAVRNWRIPDGAFADSLAELARDGQAGAEGVALWLGHRRGGEAEITHLVALRGPGVIKRRALLRIEAWLLNDVTDLAIDLGVSLIGQIHSHGGGWVDLSPTDRADGIMVPYYLSVVAPHFGLRPGTSLVDCGIHVFEPQQGWRRLSEREIATRLRLVPNGAVPLLTVGEG